MSYVVSEPCIGVKDKACVDVCPADCFYEDESQLYIHPDECVDCGACEPECPVEAIFADSAVPEQYEHWTQINIDEAPKYPIISAKIPALYGPTCTGNPE